MVVFVLPNTGWSITHLQPLLHNNKSSTLPLPHTAAAPSPTPPSHSALALHIPQCYHCSLSPQPQGRHRGLPNSPPVPSARDNELAAPIGCKPPKSPSTPPSFCLPEAKSSYRSQQMPLHCVLQPLSCSLQCCHGRAAFSAAHPGAASERPSQALRSTRNSPASRGCQQVCVGTASQLPMAVPEATWADEGRPCTALQAALRAVCGGRHLSPAAIFSQRFSHPGFATFSLYMLQLVAPWPQKSSFAEL